MFDSDSVKDFRKSLEAKGYPSIHDGNLRYLEENGFDLCNPSDLRLRSVVEKSDYGNTRKSVHKLVFSKTFEIGDYDNRYVTLELFDDELYGGMVCAGTTLTTEGICPDELIPDFKRIQELLNSYNDALQSLDDKLKSYLCKLLGDGSVIEAGIFGEREPLISEETNFDFYTTGHNSAESAFNDIIQKMKSYADYYQENYYKNPLGDTEEDE